MSLSSLNIKNLSVRRAKQDILKGITLTLRPGEITVLMGPNGSGKSTLANAVMGHPAYQVSSGQIRLDGRDLLKLEPHERSRAGLHLSSQQPPEIPGVSLSSFLRAARNTHCVEPVSVPDFRRLLLTGLKQVGLPPEFARRALNEGFSGGEKKRSEMLQLLVLQPRYALLDELDAGLDADGLKTAVGVIETLRRGNSGVLVITHSTRLLRKITPTKIHVISGGRVIANGGLKLANSIENLGYDRALARRLRPKSA